MASKKIPKQLYVTARSQGAGLVPLGFLNSYEPGKVAFESKKNTQEKWAYWEYSHIIDARVEMHGPDGWVVGDEWAYDNSKQYGQPGYTYRVPVRKPLEFPPLIWDNTPMRGFKIEKSVSRYSTSNKLWRILDPRNVEFEITTLVLEQLIDDAGILKGGEIDAPCVWQANKNLVIVP